MLRRGGRVRRYLSAACVLLAAGCGGMICTQIGCDSGLRVTLERSLRSGDRLELHLGASPPWIVECHEDNCGAIFLFSDVITDRAIFTQVTSQGHITHELFPDYERVEPNGAGCGHCDLANLWLGAP